MVILPFLEEAAAEVICSSLLPATARVVVSSCGTYGQRLASAARRLGHAVTLTEAAPGEAVAPSTLIEVVHSTRPDAVLLIHGEGSTGVLQPMDGVGEACRRVGALLLVDASFTLSGVDLRTSAWEIDAAWSGTQRCLSAVAGLTLVALGPRALERLAPGPSSALHLSRALSGDYEAFPAPLLYALVEVLQLCNDQGLAYRFSRHRNRQMALIAGLQALGLEIVAAPAVRLPSVTVARVPAGVDGEGVRRALLDRFRLEIGGPMDATLGPVWRIGVMGHSAAPANILLLCSALEVLLEEQGCQVHRGAAARAALAVLEW